MVFGAAPVRWVRQSLGNYVSECCMLTPKASLVRQPCPTYLMKAPIMVRSSQELFVWSEKYIELFPPAFFSTTTSNTVMIPWL
jgi:hypothetical protein